MTDEQAIVQSPPRQIAEPEQPQHIPGRALLGLAGQRRWRELGRLRMGAKRADGVPYKLNTWRLTSHSRELLDAVAALYGGTVEEWKDAPTDGDNFQVTTEAASLRVIVPPGEVLSQWFELWSGGGCKKRCDGENQALTAIRCSCPEAIADRMELAKQGKACTPSTRLSLMLLGVPDLGVWRLETHGYTAAQEIAGTFDVLKLATDKGSPVPARLTITHRTTKSIDPETQKARTSKFTVPALEIDEDIVSAVMAQLPQLPMLAGTIRPPLERPSLPGTPPPLTTDTPDTGEMVTDETPTFAEQPPEARGLPSWIMELPGTDGDILDTANLICQEHGIDKEFASVGQFVNGPPWFQDELQARLAGDTPDPEVHPEPGEEGTLWGGS